MKGSPMLMKGSRSSSLRPKRRERFDSHGSTKHRKDACSFMMKSMHNYEFKTRIREPRREKNSGGRPIQSCFRRNLEGLNFTVLLARTMILAPVLELVPARRRRVTSRKVPKLLICRV